MIKYIDVFIYNQDSKGKESLKKEVEDLKKTIEKPKDVEKLYKKKLLSKGLVESIDSSFVKKSPISNTSDIKDQEADGQDKIIQDLQK